MGARLLRFVTLLIVLLPTTGSAVPITLDLSGTIARVDAPLTDAFAIGDAFSLRANYETQTQGQSRVWCTPDECLTDYFGALLSLELITGPYAITANNELISINNNTPADEFQFPWIDVDAPTFTGLDPAEIYFGLVDLNASTWDSTDLPLSLPALDDFTSYNLVLAYEDRAANRSERVQFAIDRLATTTTMPVPEPSSLSLFVIGILALVVATRGHARLKV
jgi:hypothetical protein